MKTNRLFFVIAVYSFSFCVMGQMKIQNDGQISIGGYGSNSMGSSTLNHRISDSALLPGFDGKLMAELQELEKKPTIFTKYNYYEEQLRRGMGRSNKITGRFLYDVGEALFELEEELVLNAGKTYTFPVSFDLSGCSGFALEGICDLEPIPDDPAFQTGAYTAEGSVSSGPLDGNGAQKAKNRTVPAGIRPCGGGGRGAGHAGHGGLLRRRGADCVHLLLFSRARARLFEQNMKSAPSANSYSLPPGSNPT